jgi:Skp family chaperone for outer membrane proteins
MTASKEETVMKTALPLFFVAALALIGTTASAQDAAASLQTSTSLRIACFSPQRAFSESSEGRAVIARLETLQNQKARAIDEKNRALTEVERTKPAAEAEKFRVDVQRFIEDARVELMGIQRDAESAFVVRLKPALAKVAEAKGLQIVFNVDEGQVAWFDPSLDITSDVVKQLASK